MDQVSYMEHFTHPKHQLKQIYKNVKFDCGLCKTTGKGLRYRCQQCDYTLHDTCATCPATVYGHYSHRQHHLEMATKPISLLSFRDCQLCRHSLRGFAYRCKSCDFYIHPICSRLLETLEGHPLHPPHRLKMESSSTGDCDVCGEKCKHWRYYCAICEVHIHLKCLKGPKEKQDDKRVEFWGAFFGLFVDIVSQN